ncbi:unnamed protein product [Rotaria magnacalcarata]|uniref:Phosphoserine phosphatase n=3 Tax=Rotaria magnacalcarata TaxID=392030 RepID=A0A816UB40_9BILA|nr:unnamed protein product [Rotaria magnacalcarata]
MWSFIKFLQGEENRFRHLRIQFYAGLGAKPKQAKTIAIQCCIDNLGQRYYDGVIRFTMNIFGDLAHICVMEESGIAKYKISVNIDTNTYHAIEEILEYCNMTKGLKDTAASSQRSKQEESTRQLWLSTDCVCFDVDSTVCVEEAIDELAKFQQVGAQVEAITRSAMGGNMSFRQALQTRLNLIQPTSERLEQFLENYPSQLTDGISELINLLHERHVPVYLITGGFHSIVDPVAKQLNIPLKNVFANRLLFHADGSYAGFDENEMTSDSGGKGCVIKYLKTKYNYQRIIMIGDGATDMEANADGFIGFGGNVVREKVRDNAPWFVNSFYQLIGQLRNNSIDSISQTNSDDQLAARTYSTEIKTI